MKKRNFLIACIGFLCVWWFYNQFEAKKVHIPHHISGDIVFWDKFGQVGSMDSNGNHTNYFELNPLVKRGWINVSARSKGPLTWSPDGRYLAFRASPYFSAGGTPILVDIRTGEVLECPVESAGFGHYRVWVMHGTIISTVRIMNKPERDQAILYDMAHCEVQNMLYEAPAGFHLEEAMGAPSGKVLISGYTDEYRKVLVLDSSGKQVCTIPHAYGAVWSPTGDFMAYATDEGLSVADADCKNTRLLVPNQDYVSFSYLDWSPDENWLVFMTVYNHRGVIAKVNVRSGRVQILSQEGSYPNWR